MIFSIFQKPEKLRNLILEDQERCLSVFMLVS